MKTHLLLIFALIGGGVFLWKGAKPSPPGELVHYPRDLAEIKKLGGFWNLSPEQMAYVRFRYVDELKVLMEQVNLRMQLAQFSGDLASCYVYRSLIKRLQESINRVQRPSVDPTGEQPVIMNVSIYLSR
jgi:hypothetical protein